MAVFPAPKVFSIDSSGGTLKAERLNGQFEVIFQDRGRLVLAMIGLVLSKQRFRIAFDRWIDLRYKS